jgi:hypothetical protein
MGRNDPRHEPPLIRIPVKTRRVLQSVRRRQRIGVPPALTVLALLLAPGPGMALEQETQTWATGQLVLPAGEKLDVGVRYRTRFSGFFDKRRLYQYQLTLGHTLQGGQRVRLGYEQFRARDGLTENRYFPELQLGSQAGGLPLRHRLRLEWRDIDRLDDPVLRLRYKLAHRRPITPGGTYLELRNEIFVSLSDQGPLIDRGIAQNRIGFTLGQQLGQRSRLELRYQWGYIDNDVIERGQNLIQLHWTWDGR